jgi:hypothetical protein
MRFAFLIALGALLSACAGLDRDPGAATVALRLPGFTATAPAARGWIMTPGTATAQAAVRSVGDNRTLVAFASEEDLRELGGTQSGGALDKALAEIRRSYDGGRHRLRSFEQGYVWSPRWARSAFSRSATSWPASNTATGASRMSLRCLPSSRRRARS